MTGEAPISPIIYCFKLRLYNWQ